MMTMMTVMKRCARRFVIIFVLLVVSAMTMQSAQAKAVDRVQIPSLHIDLPIMVARFYRDTWVFGSIGNRAAYLEGRPRPGIGSNAVIAAHSELARRKPGPFYRLHEIAVGDEVIVIHDGKTYHYTVDSIWNTKPTDPAPLVQTETEVLTLITCADYDPKTRTYDQRLIVRAVPMP